MPIPIDTPPMPREGEPVPPQLNLRCTRCGYLLTGLLRRVCPECGETFDPLETYQANIKSTWEFHFTYRQPLWKYIAWSAAGLAAAAGFIVVGLACGFRVYRSPTWLFPCIFTATILSVRCYLQDWYGPGAWLTLAYLCLVWAVVAGIIG